MPASLATVDALLKEIYGPRIEDQLQNETVALKRIERTSDGVTETVGGKFVDFPIRVSRNSGIGYRNELEALPQAGQQGYAEVHVPLKYGYGRVRLSGQVMQLAEKNYQAFASAMDTEMDGLKDDVAKDSNRVVYGDGSGLLASLTGVEAVNTHAVDSTARLEVGQQVDVLTRSSGAVTLANVTITSITGLNVVTSGAVFTGSTLLGFYRQGNYGREPSGFGAIVSATSTLHTLAPGSQPKWAAVIDDPGSPRALSESLMIETCDKVRINGGKVSLILTSLGVRRAYFNLLTQQRRYADTKKFDGGFTGLAFNYGEEVAVVEDVDSPPSQMLFLSEKKLKVYRNKEWHWMDEDNSILKWVTDFDAFEAVLRQYWEIGTSNRNHHARLGSITEG